MIFPKKISKFESNMNNQFNEFKVDFGWGILEPAYMDGCIQAYVAQYGLAGGAEEEAAREKWRNGFKFDLKDTAGDPSGRRKITHRIRELVKLEERNWVSFSNEYYMYV